MWRAGGVTTTAGLWVSVGTMTTTLARYFCRQLREESAYHNNRDGTFTDRQSRQALRWELVNRVSVGDVDGMALTCMWRVCALRRDNLPVSGTKSVGIPLRLPRVDVNCGPRGLPANPTIYSTTTDGRYRHYGKAGWKTRKILCLTR